MNSNAIRTHNGSVLVAIPVQIGQLDILGGLAADPWVYGSRWPVNGKIKKRARLRNLWVTGGLSAGIE
ncbi:hypothetical protein SBA4_4430010 [Candidatus Sulfopaludibacter sp. SbA4]|nr:hypothetical protein SBA4_4430010 [Candidatus Sulfopaludibacter sp. SbA4]